MNLSIVISLCSGSDFNQEAITYFLITYVICLNNAARTDADFNVVSVD